MLKVPSTVQILFKKKSFSKLAVFWPNAADGQEGSAFVNNTLAWGVGSGFQ